ncbi:hypothetical protein JDS79_44650, partial [Bacillus cereus]|nr:hypothetical protein [Bacillus cereus]
MKVLVRTDKEIDYTSYQLTQSFNDSLYHYLVPAATLIGSQYIEYYFIVSDGTNEV